jgi:hypothetical protein
MENKNTGNGVVTAGWLPIRTSLLAPFPDDELNGNLCALLNVSERLARKTFASLEALLECHETTDHLIDDENSVFSDDQKVASIFVLVDHGINRLREEPKARQIEDLAFYSSLIATWAEMGAEAAISRTNRERTKTARNARKLKSEAGQTKLAAAIKALEDRQRRGENIMESNIPRQIADAIGVSSKTVRNARTQLLSRRKSGH